MHEEVRQFVEQVIADRGPFLSVVEFGSMDVNGSVKPLFDGSDYVGVDLAFGPGVDIVADARHWTAPTAVDAVVCCEVLEHAEAWPELIESAGRSLRPNGTLIVTCAGPGRGPHSAVDGNALRPGEYYANVAPDDLADLLSRWFRDVEVIQDGADVRAVAVKR